MKSVLTILKISLILLIVMGFAFAQDTSMVVTSDGNVGIGLTNPLEKLHVNGGIYMNSSAGALRIHHSGTNNGWQFATSNGGQTLLMESNTGGLVSNLFYFHSDGSLGIGTFPTTTLDVSGDAHVSGKITSGDANVSLPIAYAFINSDGSVSSGTSNVSCVWNSGLSRYEITISGESFFFSSYVTTITSVGSTTPIVASTGSISGKLTVYLFDLSGTKVQNSFQVAVYKP